MTSESPVLLNFMYVLFNLNVDKCIQVIVKRGLIVVKYVRLKED